MEAQIAKKEAVGKPVKKEENYFMVERGGTGGSSGTGIAFQSFTAGRMNRLKSEPDQEYARCMREFLQSDDFEKGFAEIKRISAKAGKIGLESLSKEEKEKFGNFAANFNAIVKNRELFSIFNDVFNLNESFRKSVGEVFNGNIKEGFNEVSGLLAKNEKLDFWDRARLLKLML